MDHRAVDQAARINETRHDVLKYNGGSVSLEMEIPKLLWLKEVNNSSGVLFQFSEAEANGQSPVGDPLTFDQLFIP